MSDRFQLIRSGPRPRDVHASEAADARALTLQRDDLIGPAAETAGACAVILSAAGPMAALRFLNARVRFRFSGIYQADPPLLRNVHLYDRENPTLNVSGAVSRLDETYCAIVWDEERPFSTPDASSDVRLVTHVARERVQSYCGVPIRLASGRLWGTLCHYDVRPRLLPSSELELLELVAPWFAPRVADASSTP